jgi:predicted DCC family thiol-disulfide oxidoreductase YuxK
VTGSARENGWTGGQYSVFRALFGLYLAVHFAALLPWGREIFSRDGVLPADASPLLRLFPNVLALVDAPWMVTALLACGVAAAAALALGWRDRVAAVACWYVLACLFGRNPLIANPALPFLGWILLAHAFLPAAPYGSVAARGRVDPGGGWRFPQPLFAAAWIVMAVGYSYSGYTKLVSPSWVDGSALAHVLDNPLARPTALRELAQSLPAVLLQIATWGGLALELSFAPLALWRPLRPWLWTAMVGMHLGLFAIVDFADLTLGMLLLHLFTFDPAWLAPRAADRRCVVFYDGHCGLCHRFVRFVLAEDRAGEMTFAPLQGSMFAASVPPDRRATLPDSVVVKTADGRMLVRSAAVRHVLRGLGGIWRALGHAAAFVPAPLLDFTYDRVAAVRKRLFASPTDACPMLPKELRGRFGE